MATCALFGQVPSVQDKNYTSKEHWIGTATYNMSWGIVTLQIEEIEDEKYCSEFILLFLNDTIWSNRKDCTSPLSGILRGTNGHKCTFADFNDTSIRNLPTPTHCMMNNGNSSQYVSCEKKIDEGCQHINKENFSPFGITLSFINTSSEYCKDKSENAVDPEGCSLNSLIEQCKYVMVIFGSLVLILDIACICCCVRCLTRRQLLSRKNDVGQLAVRRPNSEAIEHIYINRDLSNENDTYEVSTNKTQKADASMRNEQQTMQDNDMAVSRSAKSHSGDYDLAWPGTSWSTTVASPDVDYTHVEMLNKQTMDTVPEEEIYSKQKLVWEEGNDANKEPFLDAQTKMKHSNVTENNHKKVTTGGMKRVEITDNNSFLEASYSTVVILNQNQDAQNAGYNNADDNIYSKVNINSTKQRIKKEAQGKSEKPLESITSIDNSSCMNKPTAGNDNGKLSMIKKTQDKIPPTTSTGTTDVNNLDIRFKINKTNTMTDENATVLMGNVRLETKL
nr:uncharacterized protein LOC111133645 isoform X2 [Crassostrea virginica]XP_022337880.1 uncharacterized protein LOC111133645 isoform X2 [Crassostrea virginica]